MPQLDDICDHCDQPFYNHYGAKCPPPSGSKKAKTKFKPKEKK